MEFGRLKRCLTFLLVTLLTGNLSLSGFAQSSLPSRAHNHNHAAHASLSLNNDPATGDSSRVGIDTTHKRNTAESFDRIWQLTGPFGGDVTALVIDPRNPDAIWLGTSDGQMFRSTDGGMVWKRIKPGLQAPGFTVSVIHFDREKAGVIYAGIKAVSQDEETKGGTLYRSEDNGETWREVEALHGRAVRNLAQAAKDPNVMALAARDGVYRSLDRGKAWERISPLNDPELRGFHSVAIDPRDVNIIYVGTHHLPWKTTDGGVTWKRTGYKEVGMIDDSDIFTIHIDEQNPDTVLMSACSGIYRSQDGSANWTKFQGIPFTSRRTHVIYPHPTRSGVLYAGTTEGLWFSTTNGKPDGWRRMTSARLTVNAIAIHPDRPDRVLLGTEDNGVLISQDGGETYEASNAGFINRHVRTVLADRSEKGRVYAGVIFDGVNSGLFVSEDGGITWQQSMNGMGVRDVYSLYQSARKPETVYAGTNQGLYRSDDHGRNWALVKKEEPVPPATEKDNAAPASKDGKSVSEEKTSETGATRPRRVTDDVQVKSVVQTRAKPNAAKPTAPAKAGSKAATTTQKTPANGSAKSAPPASRPTNVAAKGNAAQRNPGKGSTKKKVKKEPPPPPVPVDVRVDLESHIFSLVPFTPRPDAAAPVADGAPVANEWLIASTWDGLFYTEDEKKGWKELKLKLSPETPVTGDPAVTSVSKPRINALVTNAQLPGVFFVGTDEGLFVSRDNGTSFKRITLDEDATRRIRQIVFDPRSPETVFVGTANGFFRSLDGGNSWEHRGGGMPQAVNVAALVVSGANPDQLYLSDELRNTLFYSKDRGKNWERLEMAALPSMKLWSVVSDPFEPDRLYFGSYSGGVYVMSRQ